MITLAQKQKIIIEAIQRGKSKRAIAREMGISRNTVGKYLNAYREELQKLETADGKNVDKEEIIEEIVKTPKYERKNPHKPKMTPIIEKFIEEKLAINKKRKELGSNKRLLTIVEIHEKLIEAGYDISYSSVRNYANKKETASKEVFIRH